jgi:hypothetical protein
VLPDEELKVKVAIITFPTNEQDIDSMLLLVEQVELEVVVTYDGKVI